MKESAALAFFVFLIWFIYAATAHAIKAAITQTFTWQVQVSKRYPGTPTGRIRFFELRDGAIAAIVSAQEDAELAKFLNQHAGKKVVLRLTVVDK